MDTPGNAEAVAISGSHAYVADGGAGLEAADITNPASPAIVGNVDTPDAAMGVAVSGSMAPITPPGFR